MNAPVPRRTFGKLGSRIGARIALDIPGELLLPYRVQRCTIVDVSRSGARLRMDRLPIAAPPKAGVRIVLRLIEAQVHGSVAWVRGDSCAVQFDAVLPPTKLERLVWVGQNRERYLRSEIAGAAELWR